MNMHFIPCSRHVLINKCSKVLGDKERRQFQSFAEILNAYVHFKAQSNLELMKQSYAYFNPNQDSPVYPQLTHDEESQQSALLADTFKKVLFEANYKELTEQDIKKALMQSSLVPVNTNVNLNDYQRILLFYRGRNIKQAMIKRFFRKKQISFDNYDHVAVLLEIKQQKYFLDKDETKDELNFEPGKIYLYLYKNIPFHDLELLFPNVKISMNLRDKLMLIIPALGAAVPMLIKILPALGLLVGAIALVVFGWNLDGKFDVDVKDPKAIYPLLLASFSACVALGGFAVRQYIKYKSKRLEFLKKVTDVLFFKSLDVSQGVLNAVVDSAEEEQSKGMLLVYYLLMQEGKALDKAQINNKIVAWAKEQFSVDVNIDIEASLEQLMKLQAPHETGEGKVAIIEEVEAGHYQASNIESAKRIIDYTWDNVFQYSTATAL